MAVLPDCHRTACPTDGDLLAIARVDVLAWGAGPTLVPGDDDAALAVWDVPAAR